MADGRGGNGRGSVRVGLAVIEYEVRRSARRRKTVSIAIAGDPSGEGEAVRIPVEVAAPLATPAAELEEMVRRRAPWILRRAAERSSAAPALRFVSGEKLPLLGRPVPLDVAEGGEDAAAVRLAGGRFLVLAPAGLGEEARRYAVRGAFVAWYRRWALPEMAERVKRWAPAFGPPWPRRVLIRDQKKRWGSCAADGTLRFNWRCLMLEPELVDCIVVHELVHLDVRGHGAAFWRRFEAVMPDARSRRARLRDAGRALPTGL